MRKSIGRFALVFALLLSFILVFSSCGTEYIVSSDKSETIAISDDGENGIFEKISTEKNDDNEKVSGEETDIQSRKDNETENSGEDVTSTSALTAAETETPTAEVDKAESTGEASASEGTLSGGTTAPDKVANEKQYILNTNTKKVHLPTCPSVKDILPKNKQETTSTLDALTAQGYSLCKRCLA